MIDHMDDYWEHLLIDSMNRYTEIDALYEEIEKLKNILVNITHHEGALKEFKPIWEPIVVEELRKRLDGF